jgi:anti-anti-sigma factor
LSTTGSSSKALHTGRPHGGTGNGRGPTMEIVADGHTLVLSGDFDVRSTMDVRSAIHEAMNRFDDDVVIDLTNVNAIDLTAARVLAYATLEASRAGHHLRLRGCGPAVRRMLHLTRLARFVEVDRAAASA